MATDLDVLQVITSSSPRGAERFALNLEPLLVDRGLRVRTVALVAGSAPALDVAVLGSRRLGFSTLRAARALARTARVVAAHGSTTLPASFLATSGTGTPFVYRNIGDPYYWGTTRVRRWRTTFLLSQAAAVVALTAETGNRMSERYGVDPRRVTPIPRGVSQSEFPLRGPADRVLAREPLGIDAEALVAVFVGALSEEKDVFTAIRAIAKLPDRWQLVIVGDGPDRAAAEREAGQIAPGRVRFLGQIAATAPVITAADVLVLSSRTEGLPGVVIEAAMVGIPSVATEVGFIGEIVEPGVSGELVAVEAPGEMAQAILGLEGRFDESGRAAHERAVAGFSLESVAERWYEVLAPFVPAAATVPAVTETKAAGAE